MVAKHFEQMTTSELLQAFRDLVEGVAGFSESLLITVTTPIMREKLRLNDIREDVEMVYEGAYKLKSAYDELVRRDLISYLGRKETWR
jgi:hypothetical protein